MADNDYSLGSENSLGYDDHCTDFVGDMAPSAICSLLPQDYIITGYLRNILLQHFYSPLTIEEPDLRHLLWRDRDSTDILIESHLAWTPEKTSRRPGIIVKRNDCDYQPIGIGGDIRQGPASDILGFEHYVRLWVGSHTLFCISQNGPQAELLATEVKRELSGFADKIARNIDLKRFRVLRVGAAGKLEESAEHYVVPVTVGYAYEERTIVRMQAPTLHAVSLSLLLEG